jgi:hypothetical protein
MSRLYAGPRERTEVRQSRLGWTSGGGYGFQPLAVAAVPPCRDARRDMSRLYAGSGEHTEVRLGRLGRGVALAGCRPVRSLTDVPVTHPDPLVGRERL